VDDSIPPTDGRELCTDFTGIPQPENHDPKILETVKQTAVKENEVAVGAVATESAWKMGLWDGVGRLVGE
jgi:hypothetical protein